jgi:glycosyltransferase involved in cell wall biosynthesis
MPTILSTGPPLVTVVTPTLNASRYFGDCLRSLRSQVDVRIEHIVVDDGSSDDTIALAKAAGAHIIDGERRGLYAAMNLGLERASGDFVGILNADDFLYPAAIAALLMAMRRRGRPWSVGQLVWLDGEGKNLGGIAPPPSWAPVSVLACLGWNWVHHQTTYMTRDFWNSLGGFDTSFRSAADYDLLLRARRIAPFATVRKPTGAFRRHGGNLSMTLGLSKNEVIRIRSQYGPHSAVAAAIFETGARTYVNVRNPKWSLTKRLNRVRRR